MGRGRKAKIPKARLSDIVKKLKSALHTENADAIFEQLMRLKIDYNESYYGEGLDQILDKRFRLRKNTKDFLKKRDDEKLVRNHYENNLNLFGFETLEEYELSSWVASGDAMVDLLQMVEELPEGCEEITFSDGSKHRIEDLLRLIESQQELLEKNYANIKSLDIALLSGRALPKDIQDIVQAQGLRSRKDRNTLSKRLKNQLGGNGRGRSAANATEKKLYEQVCALRVAFVNSDKPQIFKQMLRLKKGIDETYMGESLDRILDNKFQKKKPSIDSIQTRRDKEQVRLYYKNNPQKFGFTSVENYELKASLPDNAVTVLTTANISDVSICTDLNGQVTKLVRKQHKGPAKNISSYEIGLILGIPRAADIVAILEDVGLNQKMLKGNAMAKRLRKLRKEFDAGINP